MTWDEKTEENRNDDNSFHDLNGAETSVGKKDLYFKFGMTRGRKKGSNALEMRSIIINYTLPH